MLIKIGKEPNIPNSRKAPRCNHCGIGIPEYQGMYMRKKDGKVFSVWKCTHCRRVSYGHESAKKVGEYDNPRAIKVSSHKYQGIEHAIALPRPW